MSKVKYIIIACFFTFTTVQAEASVNKDETCQAVKIMAHNIADARDRRVSKATARAMLDQPKYVPIRDITDAIIEFTYSLKDLSPDVVAAMTYEMCLANF